MSDILSAGAWRTSSWWRSPFLVMALVSVAAVLPSLLSDLLLAGHDAKHHIRWLHFFGEQFWQGTPYPRWLHKMNDGFGSPVFFIYPPLPYFITGLLHPLAPDPAAAPYKLAAGMALSLFVGGMGMFLWMREILSRRNALLSAILFVLLPYHLFIDVYLRVAYAELWAFAWAPWCLFMLHRLDRNPLLYGSLCAAGMAAITLSHAPSTLLLAPAILVYALSIALIRRSMRPLVVTICALVLSLPLCAAYLATALDHGSLINEAALFDGRHHYARWLLFAPEPWPSAETGRMILAVLLVQAAMTLACGLVLAAGPVAIRQYGWAPLLLAAGSIFMMTAWSDPVWRLFPMLQKVQFPWRFLLVQTIALAVLAGLALEACDHPSARPVALMRPVMRLGLIGLALVNLVLLPPILATRPTLSAATVFALPHGAREYVLGDLERLSRLLPDGTRAIITMGRGDVRVSDWHARRIAVEVEAQTALTLAVRQFLYSGWRYETDSGTAGSADALAPLGIVGLKLPPGRHHVELTLTPGWKERVGRWVSLLSIAALLAMAFLGAAQGERTWANGRVKPRPPSPA